MSDKNIRKEWVKLMAPIAQGYGTEKMVKAFDSLTSLALRNKIISFQDFMAAQVVIGEARKAATAQSEIANKITSEAA